MKIALQNLFDEFASHQIRIKPQLDGNLLLTLEKPGCIPVSIEMESDAVFCPIRVGEVILDLRMDMRLDDAQQAYWADRIAA